MTAIMNPPSTVLTKSKNDAVPPASKPELVFASSVGVEADVPAVGDPMDTLIEQWVSLAVRHARLRRADDLWVADVVGLDGAWSDGASAEDAVAGLAEVLADWVTLKLNDGDRDIPPMEGVKLVLDG